MHNWRPSGVMPYRFYLVREIPEGLVPADILGVEITSEFKGCNLGNIDPQHGKNGSTASSAIEEALHWEIPPLGATLVTDRPDADSLGAMAVLHLRMLQNRHIDTELVHAIGRVDSLGESDARNEVGVKLMEETRVARKAIAQIIRHNDHWPTTEKQVVAIARVLSSEMDIDEMLAIANLHEASGHVEFEPLLDGLLGYAEVTGDYREARSEGQKFFPFTLVSAPLFPSNRRGGSTLYVPRFTIVVKKGLKVNMRNLEEQLSREEARVRIEERNLSVEQARAEGLVYEEQMSRDIAWGGPQHIVSSPEMNPTRLRAGRVLEIVERFIEDEYKS